MNALSSLLLAAPTTGADAAPASLFWPQTAFWALSLLTVGGAIVTVTRKNAVSAVMALVATFFGLAGLYLLLSAQFLAAIQVLVYAGAIMTLFVFVVMVLNREEAEAWALRGLLTKALGVIAAAWLFVEIFGLVFADVPSRSAPPPADWGGVADVGTKLFNDYVFPFEALSLMLLIAVIGAVVVARTPKKTIDEHAGGLGHGATPAANEAASSDEAH